MTTGRENVLVWPARVSAPRRLLRRLRGCEPHDRYLLEQIILRRLRSRGDVRRILFVGCAKYTRHYPAVFADREFITIDSDPAQARYGGATHIVDTLANLAAHITRESLDVVVCNGVIGWGLDDPEEIDKAVGQCFQCLRPGGLLILGWNDVDRWRPPVPIGELGSVHEFEPTSFPPFPGSTYPTLNDLRHVFSFFARPVAP